MHHVGQRLSLSDYNLCRLTPALFLIVLFQISMQTIAILSKQTRQGVSTFRFVQCENGEYWMFGGVTPKAIQFADRKQLESCIMQWRRYGYSFGLPTEAPVAPKAATKKQFLSDPWSSELPSSMQMELEVLPA
jgi:hypothetical protein